MKIGITETVRIDYKADQHAHSDADAQVKAAQESVNRSSQASAVVVDPALTRSGYKGNDFPDPVVFDRNDDGKVDALDAVSDDKQRAAEALARRKMATEAYHAITSRPAEVHETELLAA